MSIFLNNIRRINYLIIFGCVLMVTACSQAPRRPEPDDLVWPLPPETPRIKYIQSIYSEDDIGRIYSLKEKIFGKDYLDTIVRPYGLYVIRNKIYVTDLFMKGVFVFDLKEKRLKFMGSERSLQVPSSVAVDAAGSVFVADSGGEKVVVYDAKGNLRSTYPLPGVRPVALAVNDALGRLYVVDRTGHRVLVMTLDGKPLFEFGGPGDDNGRFNLPISITVDSKGMVYVLDGGNFRVQVFDGDGKYVSRFGDVGDNAGTFANPKGIAVDSEGHVYVTDAAFSNFQIFDQKGNLLLFVGSMGALPGYLHLPASIAIDENDHIYVADQFNRRIQEFQYLKTP